ERAAEGGVDWKCWAVGDSCCFWVRGNVLLLSFPVTSWSEFGIAPLLFRSKPIGALPEPVAAQGTCRPGDLFLFATDAMAQNLLRSIAEGTPPDWERFWVLDADQWRREIETLRDRNEIVDDDCTMVLVRIPIPAEPGVTSVEPES